MACALAIACMPIGVANARWKLHGGRGTATYATDGAAIAETAVIRPAALTEARAPRPNAFSRWTRGLPSKALLLAISRPPLEHAWVDGYDAVRVLPGAHKVKVMCLVSDASMEFVVDVVTVAGHEYLIECTGNRQATAGAVVFDAATGAELSLATQGASR
jgi:hypothetical protein